MEIVLNTFGVSLNCDNEAFVITSKVRQLRVAYQIASKQYNEQKRTLPYAVCGIFNPPYRKTENFGYIECFVLDISNNA